MPDVARLIILRSTLCFLILILCADVYAQKTRVDELLTQLDKNDADTNQIKVMRKLSAAYSAVDPVKKFYYANQYLILAEKHNIDSTIANAYLDMGISYGIRSNVDSALYYFKLGYERAKASNYSLGIARSHANIGYAYDRSDRKKEAIQHYENALKIFKKYNIKKSINQNITNLGSLYYDLGEYKIADGYFRQVLASVRETPADEIGLGNALFSLGNSNLKLGNQTKALGYFKESLAVREKIGDLNGIALSNWGIGRVLIEKEQYQQSLIPLNIALKNNRILKNLYHESAVLMSISRAHLALKKYEKAEEEADLALQRANESSSRGLVSQALELLVDINKEQKDFAEALRFQSNYIAVKDSLNSHEMKKDVLVKDINRVNSDNKDLQLDNETIASKNSEYVLAIFIITVLLIFVVVLLILYYRRNLEKKVINVLLQNRTKEIAEANEELGSLNDELTAQMDLVSLQNTELEKLNAVKNKFFSIVSHDLRSPLNTLKMLFELYRKGDLTEDEFSGVLIKLEDTIYTTATFLDNLLEWSKSQLEGMVVKPSIVSVDQVINDNIKLMESQIRLKELNVTSSINSEALVFADPDMLNVVIRNLLSNAIKFCNPKDTVTFKSDKVDDKLIVSVIDSGPGMSEHNVENLFNLSHTVSTGTSGEKGYHLGLILCKDMITQNKGNIVLESTLGKGTAFHITLPTVSP